MKDILIIDGYNMIHRSRFKWGGGLADGDNQIIYNFFRLLKSTITQFSPSIVYFPLDGMPKARLEADPNYKGNRTIDTDDQEVLDYWASFKLQKRFIINSLKQNYPIKTLYHPHNECDDLVYYLIKHHHPKDNVTIVSSDTDFIQILNEFPDSVKLYNPIAKKYRENTEYDYVSWKAMVGDKADNIPGVRGIGKVGAEKILRKEGGLQERMKNPSFKKAFTKSFNLIKFVDLKDEESNMQFTWPTLDIDAIEAEFEELGFESMLKQNYISSYEEEYLKLERERLKG
jgi:DNA polymerase-1